MLLNWQSLMKVNQGGIQTYVPKNKKFDDYEQSFTMMYQYKDSRNTLKRSKNINYSLVGWVCRMN